MLPDIKYIELLDASEIKICSNLLSLSTIKILTTGQSWYNSQGYFSENHESEKIHNESIINMKYEEFIDIVYEKDFERFKQTNSIENFTKKLKRFGKTISELNEFKEKGKLNKKEEEKFEHSEEMIIKYQTLIANIDRDINNYIEEQKVERDKGNSLFPDLNKSVKDYFNYIWSDITSNIREKGCDDETTIDKCAWLSKFIDKIEIHSNLQNSGKVRKMVELKSSFKKRKSNKRKTNKRKSKKRKSNKSSK